MLWRFFSSQKIWIFFCIFKLLPFFYKMIRKQEGKTPLDLAEDDQEILDALESPVVMNGHVQNGGTDQSSEDGKKCLIMSPNPYYSYYIFTLFKLSSLTISGCCPTKLHVEKINMH